MDSAIQLIEQLSATYYQQVAELQASGSDPLLIFQSFISGPNKSHSFTFDDFGFLATFGWTSPFNFQNVDTGSCTLGEWLEYVSSLEGKDQGGGAVVGVEAGVEAAKASASTSAST